MTISLAGVMSNAFCLAQSDYSYGCLTSRLQKTGFDIMPRKYDATDPAVSVRQIPVRGNRISICHYDIVKMAKALSLEYVTVFEDDCFPATRARWELESVLNTLVLPDDIELLSFGNLHWVHANTVPAGHRWALGQLSADGLIGEIRETLLGTQAYIVFKSGYDKYLDRVNKAVAAIPCDHYHMLVDHRYATTRSFFVAVRNGVVQHQDHIVDRDAFMRTFAAEFPKWEK